MSQRGPRINVMSLLRILWARRLIVLTPTIFALLGGAYVMLTLPPRYEATTRVILDAIKPDPVTGFRLSSKTFDAYVQSQVNIIRDDQVTVRVAEALGWLQSPDIVAAWQADPNHGTDMRHWIANRISMGIGVSLLEDSNILEIKYQAPAPDMARVVADNIRTAYTEASVDLQRRSAQAGYSNFAAVAQREAERLVELEQQKAKLEKETGVFMQGSGASLDERALAGNSRVFHLPDSPAPQADPSLGARMQLAQMDSALESAARVYGPNHPMLARMKRQRELLAMQVAALQPRTPTGDAMLRQAEVQSGIMRDQISKVLAQGDKVLALHLLTDEIQRRQLAYGKAEKKYGELRQLADITDVNLTPLGQTTVAPKPVFPIPALVLGGSAGLGLIAGVLLAFLLETFDRRVRTAAHLQVGDIPVLASIPRWGSAKGRRAQTRDPMQDQPDAGGAKRPSKAKGRRPRPPRPGRERRWLWGAAGT